jgi:hypothetical protein
MADTGSTLQAYSDVPEHATGISGQPRTRAEVVRETLRAMAAGAIPYGEVSSSRPAQPMASAAGERKTRAEVVRETRLAMAADAIPYGELSTSRLAPLDAPAAGEGKTRAEVVRETRLAMAAGAIPYGELTYPGSWAAQRADRQQARARGAEYAARPSLGD